jgi:DNA-binding NtrC family response regulator
VSARILLVDDNTELRSVLRLILVCAGHAVSDAANGRQALKQIAEKAFDLVVTDLLMPEMDGLETIFAIHRAHPCLPIIAMSGGGMGSAHTYLNAARLGGAGRILEKPFANSELLRAVDELLCTSACAQPVTPS